MLFLGIKSETILWLIKYINGIEPLQQEAVKFVGIAP